MISKQNIKNIIELNINLLPTIKAHVNEIWDRGIEYKYKPITSIKNYLIKNTEVILFPSKSLNYGGMVLYRSNNFYIHINTLQPKTYENFVWAHEFYHYVFEKELIKNVNEVTFVNDSNDNQIERKANLFAAEFLINKDILKTVFDDIKNQNPDEPLQTNVIRLMATFILPYKTLVIKLAQDGLISIDEAEDIIDYPYRDNLPQDFDLTILEPSKAIKIDGLNSLINENTKINSLSDVDMESIVNLKNKHLQQLESIRKEI